MELFPKPLKNPVWFPHWPFAHPLFWRQEPFAQFPVEFIRGWKKLCEGREHCPLAHWFEGEHWPFGQFCRHRPLAHCGTPGMIGVLGY